MNKTKRCSECLNYQPLTEFHKLRSGYLGVAEKCRNCVCDHARAKRIMELETKASRLVNHLERYGPPHLMSLNSYKEDERFILWEVTSDLQWLRSLPPGLPREGCPRVRPRHVQNPWSTGMGLRRDGPIVPSLRSSPSQPAPSPPYHP